MTRLTVADAIVVVALLVFAIAWPVTWVLILRSGSDASSPTAGGALLLLTLIFGPTVVSLCLVWDRLAR